jgi:UDP-galactopyranose mutase
MHTYEEMREEVKKLPGNLTPLAHNIEASSYIIHQPDSRYKVQQTATLLEQEGLFLLGRFAQWEYFNMDACIKAAMQMHEKLVTYLQVHCHVP